MKNRRSAPTPTLRVVDVAHPPLSQGEVEDVLMHAWMEVRNSSSVRVLKVIHGYGSSGRGGLTHQVVRNWSSRMRGRFRSVIAGEEYSLYHTDSQEMRQEVGPIDDAELEAGNRGFTYFWIK